MFVPFDVFTSLIVVEMFDIEHLMATNIYMKIFIRLNGCRHAYHSNTAGKVVKRVSIYNFGTDYAD